MELAHVLQEVRHLHDVGERRSGVGENRLDVPPRLHRLLAERGADHVHVAGLALVDAHARRGVALHMFDRAITFAQGQMHIGDGDVVLQVNKSLVRRP